MEQEFFQREIVIKEKISDILLNQEHYKEDTVKTKIKDIINLFSIQIYDADIFGSLISTNSTFKDAFMEASLDVIRVSETQWNWAHYFPDECISTPAALSQLQIWINEKAQSRKEFQLASVSLNSFLKHKTRLKEENDLQQKKSDEKEQHRKILESSFGGENDLNFNGILAQVTFGSLCFCPSCQKLSKQKINSADDTKFINIISIHKTGIILPRTCQKCYVSWDHTVSYWMIFTIAFTIALFFLGLISSIFPNRTSP